MVNHAKRAKTVLVSEWIYFIVSIIALAIEIGRNYEEIERGIQYKPTTMIIYAVVIPISLLIGLLLNILLTHGVNKGISSSLKVWAVIAIVFAVLYVIGTILFLIGGVSVLVQLLNTGVPIVVFPFLWRLAIIVAVVAYKILSIIVILQFRRELTTTSAALDGEGGVVYSFPTTPKP